MKPDKKNVRAWLDGDLKYNKYGVGIIADYSRDYTVVNGV